MPHITVMGKEPLPRPRCHSNVRRVWPQAMYAEGPLTVVLKAVFRLPRLPKLASPTPTSRNDCSIPGADKSFRQSACRRPFLSHTLISNRTPSMPNTSLDDSNTYPACMPVVSTARGLTQKRPWSKSGRVVFWACMFHTIPPSTMVKKKRNTRMTQR